MAGGIVGSIQSGGAAAASFTPTLPNSGSRVNGHYVLLIVSTENNNTVTCTVALSGTDAANWTQASPVGTGSSTTKQAGLWLYYRKVNGSESAPTVTVQTSASTEYTYSAMEVSGLDGTTPINATNTWAAINSSAVNTNQVSAAHTFSNGWILMVIGGRASSPTGTWTGPTQAVNVTDALNCYQIVGTQDATVSAAYQPKVVLSVNTLSTALAFAFNLGGIVNTSAQSASISFVGANVRSTGKRMTGGLSFVGALSRRITKGMAGSLSFTAALSRGILYHLSAILSFAGTLPRKTSKTLVGTLSFSGAFIASHLFSKNLVAALSFSGNQVRKINKSMTARVSFSGALGRAISKKMAAALSFVGSLLSALPGLGGGFGALNFGVPYFGKATGFAGAGVVHNYTQALSAALSFGGNLSLGKMFTKILTSSISFAANIVSKVGLGWKNLVSIILTSQSGASTVVDQTSSANIPGSDIIGTIADSPVSTDPAGENSSLTIDDSTQNTTLQG